MASIANQQSQDEPDKGKAFIWDPNNESSVKIDGDEYYHPFPQRKGSSDAWKFFRCKRGINYEGTQQPVFCLRCCQKMKAKQGEQPKMLFYSLKWKQGFTTSHLMTHINTKHHADLGRISCSGGAASASTSSQSRLFLCSSDMICKMILDGVLKQETL
jgi:hypothetical protein